MIIIPAQSGTYRHHQRRVIGLIAESGLRQYWRNPIAAAVVTSSRGVLAGRRNDGKPSWTFIAGEIERSETAPLTAVREVKEETGLEIRATRVIGRRVPPRPGRTMIYVAAEPVRPDDLDVFIGGTCELAEVCWLTLAEADELLPDMFEPVHAYLERTL
jgi:8-oxo-dGTP pyrophosphatase MutT (NUDIX family)